MLQDTVSWGTVGAFAGFCVGVVRSMVNSGTLFDFVAVTPGTIDDGVLSVDLAFLGFIFGVVCYAYNKARELDQGDEVESEDWVEVKQGNRIARLYGVDAETLIAISQGYSRRRCAKDGISETRFNKATRELGRRGVSGQFTVL